MTEPTVNVPLLRDRRVPLAERFWSHVEVRAEDECWLWTGRLNNKGYGLTSHTPTQGGRSVTTVATRAAWFVTHGRWPVGFMCHTCDNPPCVNPAHLFEGDQRQNMQDASAKGRARGRYSDVTHCIHGHPFDEENTYTNPTTGRRACRTCYRAYDDRRKGRTTREEVSA